MKLWTTLPIAMAFLVLGTQAPLAAGMATLSPAEASVPLYRVTVVQGSAKAINYRNMKNSTTIELKGTVLMPGAMGEAKVETEKSGLEIKVKVKNMVAASTFGGEYLTYVLWGISPEGRATNLGEILIKNGKGKVRVMESLQSFGLVVTAEPYFAVTQPSDVVVMENAIGKDAAGQVELIEAKYELLKRGQYTLNLTPSAPLVLDKDTPFEVYQARNAVNIARAAGASMFAGEAFGKAENFLKQAETNDGGKKGRIMMAREAVQRAEDARLIAVQRQEAEGVAMERKLAQDKLDEANRLAAQAAAKAAAEAAALQANAANSAAQTQEAQAENQDLRSKLMDQLNAVLKTKATARGLIVNMSGVLFQNGKATLLPAAREKLAKIAGILSVHKALMIEADGYTDSTGSDGLNQALSEKRAEAAKDYLVSQGIPSDRISSKGFGKEAPIASNETASGRSENRRVELVVSGGGLTPSKQ